MSAHFPARLQLLEIVIAAAIGSAHGDMIGVDTEILQAFLNVDSDRGTPAPDADDKVRAKPALVDFPGQIEGILE